MRISLLDRSLYYKSLMMLIRKDHVIHDEEKKMMMHIGKMLGFEAKFCAGTIEEILDNQHIRFSRKQTFFIRDGLRLSASDGNLHKVEITWLESVAKRNSLQNLWAEELEKFNLARHAEIPEESLELRHFKWE